MIEGVVFQDASGRIVAANPAAERLLGLTLDQMLGRTSMDPRWNAIDRNGNPLPGDQHPAMISLRTGQPVRGFVMGVFNPQTERTNWLRINSVPVLQDGKVVEVYATFYDINDEIEKDGC
jgi:two-component system CheB/CheR fusion protein